MVSLKTTGRRFESTFYTAAGLPFLGVIGPQDEGQIAGYDFSEPRMILRVRSDSQVRTGTIFMDTARRRWLMADHDEGIVTNEVIYRTHRIYKLNNTVLWQSPGAGSIDPLTKLSKATGKQDMGMIEVLIEQPGTQTDDPAFNISEDTLRVVTNAPIMLGDIVDGMTVRRLTKTLGVWMGLIQ